MLRLFTPVPGVSRTASVESWPEASGFLVVPLVFKTSGRRAAPPAGSIPVRLRQPLFETVFEKLLILMLLILTRDA
jgi:hypothetical protein